MINSAVRNVSTIVVKFDSHQERGTHHLKRYLWDLAIAIRQYFGGTTDSIFMVESVLNWCVIEPQKSRAVPGAFEYRNLSRALVL
jgi:hypothetical protein